ncbi:unnamed protein product [Pseudo-nitzschia multistriata]|uniref:Alanine racemase C-terminal domain-containing protein n=1 Tax=Pseudo-nitzschia multistriata TaxID=183589 RepID=A0A448Z1C5_9STRA|nr:unnamed protein product [Pseudo-nitzschia multistriata]
MTDPPPLRSIVVGNPALGGGKPLQHQSQQQHQSQPVGVTVDTTLHRAVHRIRLSALSHNYSEVESAANRQRCSVIVVVKADGYGHGAIPSAIFLADRIGADAFAVATLEEGIALRKALQETAPTNPGCHERLNHYFNLGRDPHRLRSSGASLAAAVEQDSVSVVTSSAFAFASTYGYGTHGRKPIRASHIRILVLGPPVGFPRCFDDYYHYNIEAMISGPEVAMALYEWVSNTDERKRLQVERAANELKEKILLEPKAKATALHNTNSINSINTNSINANTNANTNHGASKPEGEPPSAGSSTAQNSNPNSNANTNANAGDNNSLASSTGRSSSRSSGSRGPIHQQIPSATLTNVTGSDLAREVREILKNQKIAAETQKQQQQQQQQQLKQEQLRNQQNRASTPIGADSSEATPVSSVADPAGNKNPAANPDAAANANETATNTKPASALASAFSPVRTNGNGSNAANTTTTATSNSNSNSEGTVQAFAGLEEMARHSRIRQKAMESEVFHDRGGDEEEEDDDLNGNVYVNVNVNDNDNNHTAAGDATKNQQRQNHDRHVPTSTNRRAPPMLAPTKKRLRWHALVDSGMGRLGFKTDPVTTEDHGKRRDTVEILKELADLEVTPDCPVEFYGMCTHMADASNSTSTFTDSQMNRFKSLLKRVRGAGISVPTISTDNSAALLTTNLTHFSANARVLLAQNDADSRGFVRTGGAIYGQRPSFEQLKAVSTLVASVRHVATLRAGESVGYDRAYVAPTSVRIATLTIGFADGYPRELGNGVGSVSIRGHLFSVAGNVCMDMLMVELGPAGETNGPGAAVAVGDVALLWGPDEGEEGEGHVRLRDVAEALGTTQSALTCGLNKERVLRKYA